MMTLLNQLLIVYYYHNVTAERRTARMLHCCISYAMCYPSCFAKAKQLDSAFAMHSMLLSTTVLQHAHAQFAIQSLLHTHTTTTTALHNCCTLHNNLSRALLRKLTQALH